MELDQLHFFTAPYFFVFSEFKLYRYTNSWIFLVNDSLEGIGYNKNSL